MRVAIALNPIPDPAPHLTIAVTSMYTMRSPITSTAPLCSIVKTFGPLKSGANPPPHNGQELQLPSALLATTLEPVSSSTYVAAAVRAASLRKDRSRDPADGGPAMTAVATRNPRIIIARPRWTTTNHGWSSFATTIPPNAPSPTTPISDAVAIQATSGRRVRNTTQASTTVAMIKSPVTVPTARCAYSMIACASAGGYGRPWHRGQSGQPRPDPDTRTRPPRAICR